MNIMIRCKHCRKAFFLGFGFARHLKKKHEVTITRNDRKILWKYRIKFALLPLWLLAKVIQYALIFVCVPFHLLYEILVGLR